MRAALTLILIWGVCISVALPQLSSPVQNIFKHFGNVGASNTTWSCNKTTACVGSGKACNATYSLATNQCAWNSSSTSTCCAPGLYCLNSKCAVDNFGATCSNSAGCKPSATAGNPMACVNGTCAYIGYPGDKCTNNSMCALNVPCDNTTLICTAVSSGGDCSKGQICAFGLACMLNGTNATCQMLPQNGSCYLGAACYPGYNCVSGNCQAQYTLAAGTKCMTSDQCVTGNYCALNGTCTAVKTSYTTCTANSNCTQGTCQCSPFSGKGYCFPDITVDACTSQQSNLQTCLNKNSCAAPSDATISCCYANCYSDYKKTFSCSCTNGDDLGGSCSYSKYCGGFPIWAIIVIIVVIIVLILAVVLIVFLLMKRRRQYDTL